jgi:hypothetical protein
MTPEISSALSSVITQIVILIIGALGAALLYYTKLGVEYLKAKIGSEKYTQLKNLVVTLVKSYAQNPVFGIFDNEQKKEAVIAQLSQYCTEKGIPITHQMLDQYVEEAVKDMKAAESVVLETSSATPVILSVAPAVAPAEPLVIPAGAGASG